MARQLIKAKRPTGKPGLSKAQQYATRIMCAEMDLAGMVQLYGATNVCAMAMKIEAEQRHGLKVTKAEGKVLSKQVKTLTVQFGDRLAAEIKAQSLKNKQKTNSKKKAA